MSGVSTDPPFSRSSVYQSTEFRTISCKVKVFGMKVGPLESMIRELVGYHEDTRAQTWEVVRPAWVDQVIVRNHNGVVIKSTLAFMLPVVVKIGSLPVAEP